MCGAPSCAPDYHGLVSGRTFKGSKQVSFQNFEVCNYVMETNDQSLLAQKLVHT